MNQEKGTKSFPSSFLRTGQMEGQVSFLEQKVNALIADQPEVFLVEIRIKPTNNIKIYLDADQGISIDRLIQFNRKLYRELEEGNYYPDGNFSLEISSPGLDEPLKLFRQYKKNIGRFVEVVSTEGVRVEGKLVAASEEAITVEEEKGKGKKKEIVTHEIPFINIKTTKVQIKF